MNVKIEEPNKTKISASIVIDGQPYSSSTSMWALGCSAWKEKGCCPRGISCWFRHPGFPTHDKDDKPVPRCVVCGDHRSKECTAPGGQTDLEKDMAWEQYRARRARKGKGKGKGGKGTDGHGKSKGKYKGKGAREPRANVKIASSAEASNVREDFPKRACGVDSWAKVWLKHLDFSEETQK